jgi:hypothetical protein
MKVAAISMVERFEAALEHLATLSAKISARDYPAAKQLLREMKSDWQKLAKAGSSTFMKAHAHLPNGSTSPSSWPNHLYGVKTDLEHHLPWLRDLAARNETVDTQAL